MSQAPNCNSAELRRNHFHPDGGLHSEVAELERGDNNKPADRKHGVETTVPNGVDHHAQQNARIKGEELRERLMREEQHNPRNRRS